MARAVRRSESEVERRGVAAARLRGLLGHDPSRSFTDELIADRRAAARAESQAEGPRGSAG